MTRPLNKREIKKLERKTNEVRSIRISKIVSWSYVISLFFYVYPIVQYYRTIIDYKIVLAIFIFSGFLFGLAIRNYLDRKLKELMPKIQMIWFMVSIGFIFTSLFFILNNLFSNNQIYPIKLPIAEVHRRSGKNRLHLFVEVKLNSFTKEMPFSNEYEETIDTYNFVILDISKGGLGFEIIRDKNLVK